MKNIFIFGDSHVGYFSNNREILDKNGFGAKGYHDLKYMGYDINLIWEHGKVSYMVNKEYLVEMSKPIMNKLNKDSILIFLYGTNDCTNHLPKHNNAEVVIDRYINGCLDFANINENKLYISMPIVPFSKLEFTKKYEFCISEKCKELNLPNPIQILGNIIPRDYNMSDNWGHLSEFDYDIAFKYLLDLVMEEN